MNHTAMRLRRMGIDTYRQPVVYMRSDCTICRAEGFEAQSLVEMHVADRSIVALLNIVTTDLLAHHEAGLSEVAWRMLGARDGNVVTFAHPPTLDSFGHVRAKMYGRPLDDAAFRAVVATSGPGATPTHTSPPSWLPAPGTAWTWAR